MASTGGLYVTGNTTAFYVPYIATLYSTGWAAFGNQRGDLTVTEVAASSKLTLRPGRYLVQFHASVETEIVSGTSGDSAGIIHFGVRKDAVQVTGIKCSLDSQAADRPANVSMAGIVTVAATDTGDVEIYINATDASGNDIVVSEAQFTALMVD